MDGDFSWCIFGFGQFWSRSRIGLLYQFVSKNFCNYFENNKPHIIKTKEEHKKNNFNNNNAWYKKNSDDNNNNENHQYIDNMDKKSN